MRIALNPVGEIGTRCGLVLLGERSLAALGIYGGGRIGADRRTMRITALDGFDVFVTDDPEPGPLAAIAAEDGVSCVVSGEVPAEVAERFTTAGRTLLTGCGLRGLAHTLAAHEQVGFDGALRTTTAWTVPGNALRRGVAVGFPDPVGARWGRAVAGGIEVPISGTWAGAAVVVSGTIAGRPAERLFGVADQRDHLEALALAAGAIAVARGSYPPGAQEPDVNAAAYLSAALGAGLGVAAYTA